MSTEKPSPYVAMPDFSVDVPEDISAENFDQFDSQAGEGSFFTEPGRVSLKVTEVQSRGPSKSDPTWVTIEMVLQSVTGKEIKEFLLVPTSNLNYMTAKGKPTTFLYVQYKKFLQALGVSEINRENVLSFGKHLFGMNQITGMQLEANIGYTGSYAKYIKDDDQGNPIFVLIKDGAAVTDPESGQAVEFKNRDAVQAHAVSLGYTDYDPFIRILNWEESATPEQVKSLGTGKSDKKVAGKKGW